MMQDKQVSLLTSAIQSGDITALARGITLIESLLENDRYKAEALLERVLPLTGNSARIGVTGIPGSGKSTLIEQLGIQALDMGYKVAVLTIDPSSERSRGSILADKTRMTRLANHPRAFVRPSPSSRARGGIGIRTRECIYLCEAAGFDLLFVETVGVGQVELAVAGITDIVLLLLLPGTGDELQGMKRGSTEIADLILINKADGDMRNAALSTAADYHQALHLIRRSWNDDGVSVSSVSALENYGTAEVLQQVIELYQKRSESGEIGTRRSEQAKAWLWESIKEMLEESMFGDIASMSTIPKLEKEVMCGQITAKVAARRFFDQYFCNKLEERQ